MIGWIFILAVLTILSYLADLGAFTFLQNLRVPVINASLMSILILLCMIGMLGRLLWKGKEGEKETLGDKISKLEHELKELKEKAK
jgi:hypothetical protein